MVQQLTAKQLNEMIEEQMNLMLFEKEGCKANPLHSYKSGKFTSKKTKGSYSLSKSKVPASCDRPTGQHSRRKGSDKPQQNKEPCGRKNRKKYCRGGVKKEGQKTEELAVKAPTSRLESPQISLDTPDYTRSNLQGLETLRDAMGSRRKIVEKLGLTTGEMVDLMKVFLDAVVIAVEEARV